MTSSDKPAGRANTYTYTRRTQRLPPSLWPAFAAWAAGRGAVIGDYSEINKTVLDLQRDFMRDTGLSANTATTMMRREIGQRINPVAFKALLRAKGWNYNRLGERWQKHHIYIGRIARDAARAPHWDDAINGLPQWSGDSTPPPRLSTQLFRVVMAQRGWTPARLSQHWLMAKATIGRIANNTDRPAHWDDAVRGVPPYHEEST